MEHIFQLSYFEKKAETYILILFSMDNELTCLNHVLRLIEKNIYNFIFRNCRNRSCSHQRTKIANHFHIIPCDS